MQLSPYTPGAIATMISGREKQLEEIERVISHLVVFPRLEQRVRVFVGPRGVGKTSLLRSAQSTAESAGLHTIWVTAGDGGFIQEIIAELTELSTSRSTKATEALKQTLRTLSVSVGPVSLSVPQATEAHRSNAGLGRQLQQVLEKAAEVVLDKGEKGLALFVDEIQSADKEGLRALAYAWQHMQAEARDLPLVAFTAGLSHSQDVITDAVSFAERFRYIHLSNLDTKSAEHLLHNAAALKQVSWERSALDKALELGSGYPYFLQLVGDLAWQAAGDPEPLGMILSKHVEASEHEFEDIRNDFFRSRWMKATPKEIEIMQALAALGDGPAKRSDIAESIGAKTTDISMVRRSLMDKGLIESSSRGFLSFTAPGFAQFVRDET